MIIRQHSYMHARLYAGELLIKYITELSASSHGYAELANRTAINVHDILLALDDLGTSVPELQSYLSSLSPVSALFI